MLRVELENMQNSSKCPVRVQYRAVTELDPIIEPEVRAFESDEHKP